MPLPAAVALGGYLLLLLSLLADPIGIGGAAGIGWHQLVGAIVGALLAAAGWLVLLRRDAAGRPALLLAGLGALLVAAVVAADRAGAGHLQLGSAHLYLAALGVVLILFAGEQRASAGR
jgi:hypothetical protein